MTDEELARIRERVAYWKDVYGLYEEITVFQGDVEETEIKTEAKYMRAIITIPRDFTEHWEHLEECLSHEIAHAFLMELANWAATAEEYMHVSERSPLNDAWHLAWERTTERLARLVRKLNAP